MSLSTVVKSLSAAVLFSSASAVMADELTVYTYSSFTSDWGPGPALEKKYAETCDCDTQIKWVALEDGVSLLNRLKMEGKNTSADVVIGLDENLMAESLKTGLLTEHGVDVSTIDAPNAWSDKVFVPFDWGQFAWIYDSSKIETPVASFDELVASDAKIIYMDPRTSTPGLGLLLWVKNLYGNDSANIWSQLAEQTVTVSGGWWEGYEMFLNGEADYVLSYTTSPVYHQIVESKNNYKAAEFAQGHYRQVEVAAVIEGSEQTVQAQDFLTFLVSQDAQAILATSNWMMPVDSKTALPENFDSVIAPNALAFSTEEVAAQRKAWTKEWLNATVK